MSACGDAGAPPRDPAATPPGGVRDEVPPRNDVPAAPAPGPTTVSVTALSRSYERVVAKTPRAGVKVHAVSGTHIEVATTDADGRATLTFPESGSITAEYTGEEQVTLVTYLGVKPGDALQLGDRRQNHSLPLTPQRMTVTWAAFPGATQYYVHGPYTTGGSTGTTGTLDVYDAVGAQRVGVALEARDAASKLIGSAFLPDVAYVPGGNVTFSETDWQALPMAVNFRIDAVNAPSDIQLTAESSWGPFLNSYFTPGIDHVRFEGPLASNSFLIPSAAARRVATAQLARNDQAGRQWFRSTAAAAQTSATIDVGGRPWVTSATYDGASRVARWQLSSFERPYDAATLQFEWLVSGRRLVSWRLVVPPDVTEIPFDVVMPPALVTLLPTTTTEVAKGLRLVDPSTVEGYDAARALPEWVLLNPYDSVVEGDDPAVVSADGGDDFSLFYPY